MKRHLLIAAGMAVAVSVSANWGNTADGAIPVFPTGTNTYATEIQVTPDGGVWAMMYHPNLRNAEGETDIKNVIYEYRVQYWDKDGNPKFPEDGLLVSDFKNKSYTVVNNYLSCDSEGNLLLCVLDCRNSQNNEGSYTAYLISPDGEMLWGEEGKPVSDETHPSSFSAMMSAVPLGDGSFVFSWIDGDDFTTNVMLQRLDKNGDRQWDSQAVALLDDQCSNPYLIPSDDNTCILVYSRTASQVIYARKLDFEGSSVWGKDTRVYRGGWGSIPIHTLISVVPSGDGGALISWNDDRANTNFESAFLSYITSDGKLGFSGASDEGDVKLGYAGWRCFNVKAVPAADGSGFYAAWRETTVGESQQGLKIQKVSPEGELMWGEDGKETVPMDYQSIGYLSTQTAGDSDFMLFYEIYYSYFDQIPLASLIGADGEPEWAEGTIALSERGRKASNLKSAPLAGNKSWIYSWTDAPGEEEAVDTRLMGRLNIDGTFGISDSGVKETLVSDDDIRFDGRVLRSNANSVTVYSIEGSVVANRTFTGGETVIDLPAGIYLAKCDNDKAIKIIIR